MAVHGAKRFFFALLNANGFLPRYRPLKARSPTTEKVKRCITCWEFPLFVSFEAPDRNGAFPWCSAEAEYTAVIGAAPREQLFRSVRLNTKRLRDRECTYLANFGASHDLRPYEWSSLLLVRACLRSRGAPHVLHMRQLRRRRSEPVLRARALRPSHAGQGPAPCQAHWPPVAPESYSAAGSGPAQEAATTLVALIAQKTLDELFELECGWRARRRGRMRLCIASRECFRK